MRSRHSSTEEQMGRVTVRENDHERTKAILKEADISVCGKAGSSSHRGAASSSHSGAACSSHYTRPMPSSSSANLQVAEQSALQVRGKNDTWVTGYR